MSTINSGICIHYSLTTDHLSYSNFPALVKINIVPNWHTALFIITVTFSFANEFLDGWSKLSMLINDNKMLLNVKSCSWCI